MNKRENKYFSKMFKYAIKKARCVMTHIPIPRDKDLPMGKCLGIDPYDKRRISNGKSFVTHKFIPL